MEIKSTKTEILNDIKELKSKGVNVIMHDSFLDRKVQITLMGSISINGCANGNVHIPINNVDTKILKKPSELTLEIYLNSKEEEIISQISLIKYSLIEIEKESKVTAIADFLKEELK